METNISQIESISKQLFFIIKGNEKNIETRKEEQRLDGLALWFDVIFTDTKEATKIDSKDAINSIYFGSLCESKNIDETGSKSFTEILLSTGPDCEPTHWKQTLIFLPQRLAIDQNKEENNVYGFNIAMKQDSSNRRLYNISIDLLATDCLQSKIIRHSIQTQNTTKSGKENDDAS